MPKNATQIGPASFLYDLGNNYAGVAEVTFNKAGQGRGGKMVVVCTEYPWIASVPHGPADVYNQQDMYIFSGNETAGNRYSPTFVYHGFRYVRVDFDSAATAGNTMALADLTVRGLYMHSDVERHGTVSFAGATGEGARLDAIHKMVVQTQR